MSELSEKIKDLRADRGINQRDLAKTLGVAKSMISFWENGVNEPKASYIATIATFFNVTTDYLLGIENTSPPQIIKPAEKIQTDEQQLIEAYRKLSPGQKKGLFQMLEIDENENKKINKWSI